MSFMDKLSSGLEKTLMPIAAKIGGQKHLIALRDGFISTLPASMAGSIAVLINCVFFQADSLIGKYLNQLGFWKESIQPVLDKWVMNVGWAVQGGTLKIIAVLLTITIAYSLARSYDADPLPAAITSFCAYFTLLPSSVKGTVFTLKDGAYVEGVSDVYSLGFFGSTSMFATILTAFIATEIFVRITKQGWTIKMPEQVPPAVAKSFAAIIPACVTWLIFGIIAVIFNVGIEKSVPDWISATIQQPLMSLGQSPATYVFLIFLAQLFWFFGIHGMNIVDGVLQPMYSPALLENTDLVSKGLEPKYALTRNFVDVYAMPGGSGGTLALLVAIFLFSKKQENKELAKLAIAPGLFQINEPVIFGLPLVLNVTYFIPFILVSPLLLFLAWIFTEVIPFADYLVIAQPWTCPPVISAFVATNGDWKAAVLAAALFALAVLIWSIFVIAANKMGQVEEA